MTKPYNRRSSGSMMTELDRDICKGCRAGVSLKRIAFRNDVSLMVVRDRVVALKSRGVKGMPDVEAEKGESRFKRIMALNPGFQMSELEHRVVNLTINCWSIKRIALDLKIRGDRVYDIRRAVKARGFVGLPEFKHESELALIKMDNITGTIAGCPTTVYTVDVADAAHILDPT